ncbi:MAG TPA: hypothetical protein DCS93_05625 [Microscillaceae bacterium]|nr:hypothetical protein [Microscillaceae bacterium]
MKRYWLISLLIVLIIPLAKAQKPSYAFRVLASSGKSTFSGGKKQLYVGQRLYGNQKIKVGRQCYLSLVSRDGGTVQISKSGEYSIQDLKEKLAKAKSNAAQRYATYVISELTKARVRNINRNRYKYMNVTGSVKRASSNFQLNLAPQNAVNKFLRKSVEVRWAALKGTQTYKVVVTNEFDEKLLSKEIKDTALVIDFNKPPYKGQGMCVLKIASKEVAGQTSLLYSLINAAENKAIQRAFADFKKENTIASDNPADILEEAFFYEENELFAKALESYQKALKVSKGDEAYKVAYHHFLIRHAIGNYQKYKN